MQNSTNISSTFSEYCTGYYGFGFNGQEKDQETYGEGNEYDYGFRIYNPRIGRFLSVDPLFKNYFSFSTYNFALNSPIFLKDADGRLAVDANGNPIYVVNGKPEPKQIIYKDVTYNLMVENRSYFTNEGKEIRVEAVIEVRNADQTLIDMKQLQYNCNGYTHFTSREDPANPSSSNNKLTMSSERTEEETNHKTGERGPVLYKNTENLLIDDYEKLDDNMTEDQAVGLAQQNKIIVVYVDSEGKVGHSAVVTSKRDGAAVYMSKNQNEPFISHPYTNGAISTWGDKDTKEPTTLKHGGFYKYKGDKTVENVKTNSKGESKESKKNINQKIKNK